jgi:ABC-type phosphate transport system permease subunit
VALAGMSEDAGNFAAASDPVFLTLETLATLVVVPAAILGLVNLAMGWKPRAGWLSRSWSAALALSTLMLAYVALAFHLLGFNVSY